MKIAILLFAAASIMGAQSPQFKVLVLDALNGKPQRNVKVEWFCVGPPINQWGASTFTNEMGIATVSFACDEKKVIEIEVFPPNKKEQCGDDVNTNLNDIVSMGFMSNPTAAGGIWCPTKVSKALKPVPGQVTIFVKKPTWWQSHVAG